MQPGFTLVEMMITLAVGALLLAVGVPETISFMMTNQLITQSNEVLVGISLARSEAMKRATQVVVCSSSNGTTCSGSADWELGWIAFYDDNGNGALDAGDTIFSVIQARPPGTKIQVGANLATFTFLGNGLPTPVGGGDILICDARASTLDRVGKRIIRITAGKISVIQPSTATICS